MLLNAFIITTYFIYDTVAIICTALGGVVLLSLFLLIEPTQFLLILGKDQEVKRNFIWLQGSSSPIVQQKFDNIQANVRNEKINFKFQKALSVPPNHRVIAIVIVVNSLVFFTGFTGLTSFIPIIFSSSTHPTAKEFTIMYDAVIFFCINFTTFVIDRCNRRIIFSSAAMVCFFTHSIFAVLNYIYSVGYTVPFLFVADICNLHDISLKNTIRGELLPPSIKAVGGS